MNDIFKERLNEIMKERNLTQSQIVKKTGINKGALSCYLKGSYVPKRENIIKLATILDVNPDWLEGQDVPKEINLRNYFAYNSNVPINEDTINYLSIYKTLEKILLENPQIFSNFINDHKKFFSNFFQDK